MCPCAPHVSCNSSYNLTGFFLQVAFQLLDTDNDGYLSYSELFSLFRMVTGPTLTDDHVLGIITSILSRSDLQQPTRLTFEEFTNVSHGPVFTLSKSQYKSVGPLLYSPHFDFNPNNSLILR